MFARKRLDIGWLDLASGLARSVLAKGDRERDARAIEDWFAGGSGDAFACLSVRSGLELLLECLALPRGSEALVSALTIPDMWRVLERHGIVPVPIDVDPRTLAPRPEAWRAAVTDKTRLALVAHLFGARVDLAPIAELARARGLLVLEDCAQAFTGADFKGDARADVSMFSFGPIKTATALQGGVLRVRDAAVLAEMRARHARWPVAGSGAFAQRVLKYSALKAVSSRALYGSFVHACALRGREIDDVIQGTVRGFKGGDFFERIRHQPSAPLLALLRRRLERYDGERIAQRVARARELIELAGSALVVPGAAAPSHSHWVFTTLARDPASLVAELRRNGFDATRVATLSAVRAPEGRPELEPREARALLEQLCYIPVYPELPRSELARLAQILRAAAGHARSDVEQDERATQIA